MSTLLRDLPSAVDTLNTVAEFEVLGTPIPQGSMRAFARRGGGRPIVTSDNKRTAPWKDSVAAAALAARRWVCSGPVRVDIVFRLARPKGHYGSGRNATQRRGSAPAFPAVMPDVDKLCRAILDALVDVQVITDDALVVELTARKEYAELQRTVPGASVRVVAL